MQKKYIKILVDCIVGVGVIAEAGDILEVGGNQLQDLLASGNAELCKAKKPKAKKDKPAKPATDTKQKIDKPKIKKEDEKGDDDDDDGGDGDDEIKNSDELAAMPYLKIQAYAKKIGINIKAAGAIEKDDLIELILEQQGE